ncbi:L-fucose/L-arabinose isomerase family protein [Algisphaera agarilytica]|uniref:L-fucose isomerase-like protein n=1 Tax=Algisphaera agarilytica TaxID=1385975 RepID=A0A7X0H356_9BACT|nr:fucose isomerase [Algisphaera agarilytica]MBB6428212.1 L-fucose isomerase-like protein [Algisphaera agarilytica]
MIAPSPPQALPDQGVTTQILRELAPPLPTAAPTRIAVVACGLHIHFPWEPACQRYEQVLDLLGSALPAEQFEIVRADEPFEDPDALIRFLSRESEHELHGVLLFHAAYTAGEIGAYLGRWLTEQGLPLMSWSFPDPPAERLSANSLCCQNFLLNMLNRLDVRYAWLHEEVTDTLPEEIARFCRVARARQRLRFGKALHVGGSRVIAFYDGETDELSVIRQFGLRFDRIDLQAAFDYSRKLDDRAIRSLLESITRSSRCAVNDVPDEQAMQTLRLGLAIAHMAAEGGYIGCTIKSWPELFNQYGCACDGSVSMLNDWGLCTTEEGEMNGLISSLTMHLLSEGDAIPTMMDLSAVNPQANRIGIWHCGASPTRLLHAGHNFDLRKHSILENADPETAVGMMVEFPLALGPATLVRYQSPDAGRMFAFEGEMADCTMPFRGVYGELIPKARATASQIMGTILSGGLDHHWSLGYGHWHEDLAMLNFFLGVQTLEVSKHHRLSGFGPAEAHTNGAAR